LQLGIILHYPHLKNISDVFFPNGRLSTIIPPIKAATAVAPNKRPAFLAAGTGTKPFSPVGGHGPHMWCVVVFQNENQKLPP